MKSHQNKIRFKLTALICLFAVLGANAQPFHPDKDGYVEGPEFQQFIKQRGYQLVAAFFPLGKEAAVARVMAKGQWIYIDTKGNVIRQEDLGRVGLAPSASFGDVSIPYDNSIDQSLFMQVSVNGKYGTVNKKTQQQGLPPIYDGIAFLPNDLVEITIGNKTGIAAASGKVIIEPQYERIMSIKYDYAKTNSNFFQVMKNGKYGLLNSNGVEVLPPVYDGIDGCNFCDLAHNLLKVEQDKKWGLVTKSGKTVVQPGFEQITPLSFKGELLVSTGNYPDLRYGVIDSAGRELLPPTFAQIEYLREADVFQINAGTKTQPLYGLAARSGKILLPASAQIIGDEGSGVLVFRSNGKIGAFSHGSLILGPNYESIQTTRGLKYLMVQKDNLTGIADLSGKIIIPLKYDKVIADGNDFAVNSGAGWQLITPAGKIIKTLDYDKIIPSDYYLIVQKNGKSGIIDLTDKVLIPIKYDEFPSTNHVLVDGLAVAILDGMRYVVDRYGNEHPR